MSEVRFIRVKGRVVPVKENRLKTQAKVGATTGVTQGVGLRLLASRKIKSGATFLAGSFVANAAADFLSIRDAFRVGKVAGTAEGIKEYGKQAGVRMGASIAGGLAAPHLLKATAATLKKGSDLKRAHKFRKSTGIKDVYPSHRSSKNLLTSGRK